MLGCGASWPSPCYFEIYFQPGDNKTKESLCCPLNIRVYRIARADRQKGEIKTAEEAKQEGEKTDG